MAYEPDEHKKAMPDPVAGPPSGRWSRAMTIDGDNDIPVDGDEMAQDEMASESVLERWSNDLANQNGQLQSEHTRLEKQLRDILFRKARCEARIEMVHVTARMVDEQLQMFRQTVTRAEKLVSEDRY